MKNKEGIIKSRNFVLNVALMLLITIALSSCQSRDPNGNDAFKKVKEAKEAGNETKEKVSDTLKVITKAKVNDSDSWNFFKTETERKILINKQRIKTIKGTPNINIKLLRKVTFLEKQNDDLQLKFPEYQADLKQRWLQFKLKINDDMESINKDLLDLSVKSKPAK